MGASCRPSTRCSHPDGNDGNGAGGADDLEILHSSDDEQTGLDPQQEAGEVGDLMMMRKPQTSRILPVCLFGQMTWN